MEKPIKQNVQADTKFGRHKVQFEHCPVCPYFEHCYDNRDRKPNYLHPTCTEKHNFPQYYKGTDDYNRI